MYEHRAATSIMCHDVHNGILRMTIAILHAMTLIVITVDPPLFVLELISPSVVVMNYVHMTIDYHRHCRCKAFEHISYRTFRGI